MFPIATILTQINETLVEKGLEITPFNGAAFGALVVVLGLFGWLNWKRAEKERANAKDISMKSMELSTEMKFTLGTISDSQRELSQEMRSMATEVTKIHAKLKA